MLQIAIIGCGVVGAVHAAAIRALAQDQHPAELRWACDLDPARTHMQITAPRTTCDWAEVMADPVVDVLCICTPHPSHAEIAVAGLAAGKHVLCEKPLASTPAALERMVAAAAAHPAVVAAGIFQHRFSRLAMRLHDLIASGRFGVIHTITVRFACTRDVAYYASAPWRGRRVNEGGGVALNQAIHTLDLALWLSAMIPTQVATHSCRRRLDCIEVEDLLSATFTGHDATNGAAMTLHFSADNDGVSSWSQGITLVGSTSTIELGADHRLVDVRHPDAHLCHELVTLAAGGAQVQPGQWLPDDVGKRVYGDGHTAQLADTVEAIIHRRPPRVTFAAAAVANACVLAAYHSAAIGQPTAIPPTHAYQFPILPLHRMLQEPLCQQ